MIRILVVAACLFTGCAPSYLISQTDYKQIPKGAKKVVVSVPYGRDSLFTVVSHNLVRDGWTITTDKNVYQISSTGKSIGNGTLVKPVVFVEQSAAGSSAYFSGEFGLDADGQLAMKSFAGQNNYGTKEIVFSGDATNRSDLAFQKLVLMAKEVPSGGVSYK